MRLLALWMGGETEGAVAVADAWAQRCGIVEAAIVLGLTGGLEVLPLLREAREVASTEKGWEWTNDRLALIRQLETASSLCTDLLLAEWRDLEAGAVDVREFTVRLSDPKPAAREAASLALRWRGPAAVPLLRELRGAADPEVRARAEALLEELAVPQPR